LPSEERICCHKISCIYPDLPEAPEAVVAVAALAVEVSAVEEAIPPAVGDIVFRRKRIGHFR